MTAKLSLALSCLWLLAMSASAYPGYIIVPMMDLTETASGYQPVYLTRDGRVIPDQEFDGNRPVPSYLPTLQPVAESARVERGAHHHGDIVDYGAYTGGHGAFGWYSDHPVHGHH